MKIITFYILRNNKDIINQNNDNKHKPQIKMK